VGTPNTIHAVGVPQAVVLDALGTVQASHVVTVPDTNQKTVLDALVHSDLPVVRAASEDDVLAICAGLWMTGNRPVALIQQLGLFAAVNALRAFTHDQGVPLAILAGLYGRELDCAVEDSAESAVRLCIPLLNTLGARWTLVEDPSQSSEIERGLGAAFDESITSVVLLGAATT
jgi:sulfopyruvate decarboxylase TPP-binding subunit